MRDFTEQEKDIIMKCDDIEDLREVDPALAKRVESEATIAQTLTEGILQICAQKVIGGRDLVENLPVVWGILEACVLKGCKTDDAPPLTKERVVMHGASRAKSYIGSLVEEFEPGKGNLSDMYATKWKDPH